MIACLDGVGSGGSGQGGKRDGRRAAAKGDAKGDAKGAAKGGAKGGAKDGAKLGNKRGAGAGRAAARAGAPWPAFIEIAGAPPLARHHPRLGVRALKAVFDGKRRAREAKIADLVADAERNGRPSERILSAILHDSEMAPMSTNRRQLGEIGVECPPPGPIKLGDADLHEALWRIIYGLAFLGIFLSTTDHLDDRALLRILASRILDEAIRDVPPSADMSEFIDLGPCRPSDIAGEAHCGKPEASGPDDLMGPFEHADEQGDDDDLDRTAGHRSDDGEPPEGRGRAADRDRFLPRPRRPAEVARG